jgi:hypothetical protein
MSKNLTTSKNSDANEEASFFWVEAFFDFLDEPTWLAVVIVILAIALRYIWSSVWQVVAEGKVG